MKLTRIDIKNFRSIRNIQIFCDPSCQILVGINESGKTNILRALSFLSPEISPTNEDKRHTLPDEAPSNESFIRFVFTLNKTNKEDLIKIITEAVYLKDLDFEFISDGENAFTLIDFCKRYKEGLFKVDINKLEKRFLYWRENESFNLKGNWKTPTSSCPPNILIDENIKLNNLLLINQNDLDDPSTFEPYLEDADIETLTSKIGEVIITLVEDNLPNCVFWEYSESNILPGKIPLQQFKSNPSSCLPLKHMFELAEIKDISEEISDAQQRSNGLRNLFRRVSDKTSKHIREVWKDYKNIKIHLSENGDYIDAGIEDEFNIYDLSKRSDGFKRFISFLLLISAKERTQHLSNTLLLIDEPDISLHPSSARHLRDELIKISKTNQVFYSTHSIFMIDEEMIDRHVMVKKNGEVTKIEKTGKTSIIDEEVIYRALNFSLYELLKKNNIIFEGWRDKELFKVALRSRKIKKGTKSILENFGTCHAIGTRDIPRITAFMDLSNRFCVILSDNDESAIRDQKNYLDNHGYGYWFKYDEILNKALEVSGEDFIKSSIIKKALRKLTSEYSSLGQIEIEQKRDNEGIIDFLKAHIKSSDYRNADNFKDLEKEILNEFKEILFTNLKGSDITDNYFDYLNCLAEKVKALK